MPRSDDNLPLQRSYVEQRIGQLVGIFQIERKQLAEQVEARALPTTDGMVGLVAVADGGRLSETAFNVWTVGSQLFKEAGCPTSNRVDFNLSEYARRLWGANGKSGTLRRRIADAVTELLKTRVVVMGIDPYTLQPAEGATWELNLLEAAGARSELQAVFEAARRNDRTAVAKLASLARSADEKSTWSMVLPKWLADSVRHGQGVILDYEVQRALRGSAKRIWVQLESYTGWRTHRLARPERDEDLEMLRCARWRRTVAASPWSRQTKSQRSKSRRAVLELTSDVYEAFGLTHANRKRDLEAACKSILATDSTYLLAEVRPLPRSKRRYELNLARAAGTLRQERLREPPLRLRAEQKEDLAANAA